MITSPFNLINMWYIVVSLVVIISIILGWLNTEKTRIMPAQSGKLSEVDHHLRTVTPPDSIHGKYSREEIKKKLKKLVNSPAPVNLQPGAMCYDMAGPPPTAEYICPKCGEKTLYTDNTTYLLQYELTSCRSAVAGMKGLGITLDESQFCRKCRPEIETPGLCIEISYYGEEKPHQCCNISSGDLDILGEFIHGSKKHTSFNDAEYPLKDYAGRLEEMLGVKIKE